MVFQVWTNDWHDGRYLSRDRKLLQNVKVSISAKRSTSSVASAISKIFGRSFSNTSCLRRLCASSLRPNPKTSGSSKCSEMKHRGTRTRSWTKWYENSHRTDQTGLSSRARLAWVGLCGGRNRRSGQGVHILSLFSGKLVSNFHKFPDLLATNIDPFRVEICISRSEVAMRCLYR